MKFDNMGDSPFDLYMNIFFIYNRDEKFTLIIKQPWAKDI